MLCGESWGGCGDAALFVRVGFSDDRRLVVLIILVVLIVFVVFVVPLVVLVVFVIIVVGVSRRQRDVNDGDDARVDQPGGTFSIGGVMSAPVGCRDIHGRMLARELGDGKEDRAVPKREPRPGHGFGRRLSGVPKSLGGPWVGGVGGTPEGCINVTPFIDALQANDPFNRSPTVALPRRPLADL